MKLDPKQVSEAIRSYLRVSNPRSRPQDRSRFNRYIPTGRDRSAFMQQLTRYLRGRFGAETLQLHPVNDSATVSQVVEQALRSAAPAPRFQVRPHHVPSGGLDELEQTLNFEVVDLATGTPWRTFSGSREATRNGDGQWVEERRQGVQDVQIDGDIVRVYHGDGRVDSLPLPRVLSPEELGGLQAVFPAFDDARVRYERSDGASSWISIPATAIAADRQKMWEAYGPVHDELVSLGIASVPARDLRWGPVSESLHGWLSTDAHLAHESEYDRQEDK